MQGTEEENIESVFKEYPSIILGENEFKAFQSFYSGNLNPITTWLKTRFLSPKYAKNTKKSQKYRSGGNGCFSKNKFEEALKNFTLALNYAEFNTDEYSLALANRSATYFYLKDYQSCVKDINNCLNSNYPLKFHPKVFIRKAEALEKLKCLNEDFLNVVKKVISESDMKSEEKESRIVKLNHLNIDCNNQDFTECKNEISEKMDFEENPNFAYASTAIELSYDNKRGRHVIATRNIQEGENLFIEKAFFFAPIFKETDLLTPNKCHHCLNDIIASIPCKKCTLLMYCDENCRDESWNEFHKWECAGMTAGIWYDLGVAYPAFRGVVKALEANLPKLESSYESMVENFGNKENNYEYFNKLLTNIEHLESITQILVLSSVVINYLEKETEFFSYAKQKMNSISLEDLKTKCGGLLLRHILQLSGNASLIQHWIKNEDRIPSEYNQIACGIYPAVSMMNHSCNPNITMFYKKSTVIVKALNNIKQGEEIYNCYAFQYRAVDFESRQDILKTIYHFDCKCEVCSNSNYEIDFMESFLCPKCSGPLADISGICLKCKKPALLEYFKNLELEANALIEKKPLNIDDLKKCYKIRSSIYVKNHRKISECLDMIAEQYKKEGNLVKMLEYFNKSQDLKQASLGSNSRLLVIETVKIISDIIDELKRNSNVSDKKEILKMIKKMYFIAYNTLLLYYPTDCLELSDIQEFIKENDE
nr:SET and MYND domain-containing protein 4-like [Onthophagus taurus]